MRTLKTRSVLVATLCGALITLAGCPGAPGIPGRGGGGVDPDKCGNYADVNDAGRKLHAFLDATATLEKTVLGIEAEVRTGCDAMAKELGVSADGDTKAVCNAVFAQIQEDLSAGIQADAKLTIDYKPAVCTVNVDAAASFAAKCEAKAEADIAVTCEGSCTGTCEGACNGTCEGGGGGGECNGQCDGTCEGTCSGGCDGHADVEASAECEAQGEVHASAEVSCTPAELTVTADASVVVDQPRTDRVIAAMKAGLPQLLTVSAKIKPVQAAVVTWAATAKGVGDAGKDLAGQFKDQALCLTAQISASVAAIAKIQASVSVSVEVSASASGSVGG